MIGVVGVLFAVPMKSVKASYGTYIAITLSVCLFFYVLLRMEVIVESFTKITSYVNLSGEYIKIILKMIGVTYLAEFSAGVCKDAGYGGIAQQIEMFGKLTILSLSMPVLTSLLETLAAFVAS
jgi:stage III sporulation protein AD